MKLQPVQKTQRSHHIMSDRREINRAPLSFGLMYSGLDENEVLMGDGTVIDMSGGGLGIRGNQLVKVGMDLTLFLYLPDQEDPLFTVQAQVAWAHGHRFGVQLQHVPVREKHRLHRFLDSFSRTAGKT